MLDPLAGLRVHSLGDIIHRYHPVGNGSQFRVCDARLWKEVERIRRLRERLLVQFSIASLFVVATAGAQ
jgi:hypothetical protein